MKRKILVLMSALLFAVGASAMDLSVSYADGILTVTGAEGQMLEVVSLTGRKVKEVRVESPAQKVELNIPQGCYIIKVGNVVRKISVR